jgi:hypothetical protein
MKRLFGEFDIMVKQCLIFTTVIILIITFIK